MSFAESIGHRVEGFTVPQHWATRGKFLLPSPWLRDQLSPVLTAS